MAIEAEGGNSMMRYCSLTFLAARTLPLIALALLTTVVAFAQAVKIQGLIKSRSGATMRVQTADSEAVVVLLTDKTRVGQTRGVLYPSG